MLADLNSFEPKNITRLEKWACQSSPGGIAEKDNELREANYTMPVTGISCIKGMDAWRIARDYI